MRYRTDISSFGTPHFAFERFRILLNQLNLPWPPGRVEPGLKRSVEAKNHAPAFPRYGPDPVALFAFRGFNFVLVPNPESVNAYDSLYPFIRNLASEPIREDLADNTTGLFKVGENSFMSYLHCYNSNYSHTKPQDTK